MGISIVMLLTCQGVTSILDGSITQQDQLKKGRIFESHRRYHRQDGSSVFFRKNKEGQLSAYQTAVLKVSPVARLKIQNLNAARTMSVDTLWPGGSSGFGLTGKGVLLGVWDGGKVNTGHEEFESRLLWKETRKTDVFGNAIQLDTHATHVSGTMIAAGKNNYAKGMAPEATLWAYSADSDIGGFLDQAPSNGIVASNHSYGRDSGWVAPLLEPYWTWEGTVSVSTVEDWSFGFYDEESKLWDLFLYKNPTYLAVIAVGNDRGRESVALTHYHGFVDETLYTDTHEKDGGSDGYDSIPRGHATAKNTLSVGAIGDLNQQAETAEKPEIESYSSWGPCDDGRIKPDVVANGYFLLSTGATGDSYESLTGTSMAAPSVTGAIALIHEYWKETFPMKASLKAATIKALLIHSAEDMGAVGPDYQSGWGVPNMRTVIETIAHEKIALNPGLIESVVDVGESKEWLITGVENQSLKATLVWTDPPSEPLSAQLNPTTKMLVNNLDLSIKSVSGERAYPWVLPFQDGSGGPEAEAITGVNNTDTVEQIVLEQKKGETYTVKVTHGGSSTSTIEKIQSFSLIISGDVTSRIQAEIVNEETALTMTGQNVEQQRLLAYPNPFKAGQEDLRFHYTLSKESEVTIEIYDLNGHLWYDDELRMGTTGAQKGLNKYRWHGYSNRGRLLPRGIYLACIQATDGVESVIKKVKVIAR